MKIESNLHIICLETEAFYKLVEQVVAKLRPQENTLPKWIDEKEAKLLLNVKSKTTIQKLRDEGKVRFSQPSKKMILYDRDSIMEYIELNAKDTFK